MFKKRILTAILSISVLCSALPAYAYDYDTASYHAKATELKELIEECKDLGINTQYEEIDANIIDIYADRIANFDNNGLSDDMVKKQLADLDSLYENAKANLEAYINDTKEAPEKAYTFETGDNYRISGASLKNKKGDPYFSAGFGHFGLTEYMQELSSYGYDNVQIVTGMGDIVTADRAVDSWDTTISGGANVTFEMVKNNGASNNTSLHIVNNSEKASNVYGTIYQRVPVKPNTEYEFSYCVLGTNTARSTLFGWDDWDNKEYFGYNGKTWDTWTKVTRTFTTGENEYYKGVRFVFEGICDIYLDDITVKPAGSTKNRIINGGFDGDGTDDFDIYYNTDTHLFSAVKTLHEAEKNNMHVEVLLQLQQSMPKVILDKYNEIGEEDGRYNIDHQVAQKVEKAYIEGILSVIGDYDSLGSIIVANEPAYNSSNFSYDYGTKFANYLEQVHGSVANLKTAYGSNNITSFSNVGAPNGHEAKARFYDWKNFNDNLFATWYNKTVQIIKDCIPGIPVSLKAQPDMIIADSSSSRTREMTRGVNMDLLDAASDYHGNDAYGYYEEGGSIRNALKWYDYLDSISDKPIYDSEKHITIDETPTASNYDNITTFTKQFTWQSMIHGLDMFSIWTWKNEASTPHLTLRPKALSEVAKSSLDANRLGEQVTALANATPTVAILRSDASRIYNARYMHALHNAYNAANETGHNVGFVTTHNIESNLSDYDILIIPYATQVEENVINAIAGFDGRIIIIGSDSLGKTQYNVSYSSSVQTKINQIKNRAEIVNVTTSWSDSYQISAPTKSSLKTTLFKNEGVVVANNGSLQDNIDWKWAPYRNGYVVNISNYDTSSSKTVNITLNGENFQYVTSLIDNTNPTGSITLPKMTSGLYYVRNVNDEAIEEDTVVFYNEITGLDATRSGTTNTLTWSAGVSGSYNIYSVNPNGTLTFIGTTENESYTDTSAGPKTYAVKCVIEGGESKGKKITCGYDVNSAITVDVVKNPTNSIVINYTNNNDHSVAATVTATSYNSDGTFGSAVVMEMLIPAGKTVNYKKTLIGTGNVVIIKK